MKGKGATPRHAFAIGLKEGREEQRKGGQEKEKKRRRDWKKQEGKGRGKGGEGEGRGKEGTKGEKRIRIRKEEGFY